MTVINAPIPKRFSRSEYYRFAEAGVFDGERLELIDGELISMPPLGNRHVVATALAFEALRRAFGEGWWVRNQSPLSVKPASEPQPDLAVVKGRPRDFKDHPRTAVLVIEISDTTLLYDQTDKMSLYARNGVEDYWIVNLEDELLEVHRRPVPDKLRRFGYRYAEKTTFRSGERVAPIALPKTKIKVAELLP